MVPPSKSDHPHWQRMRFKRHKVWLAVDDAGKPALRDGKALIKYQLDQPHEYWIHPSGVTSLSDQAPALATDSAASARPRTKRSEAAQAPPTDEQCRRSICIFTDGACSGNPGPAGIGIVLRYGAESKEISQRIGLATNNIAELQAILTGLGAVKNRNLPVLLYTDSTYAMGVLTKGWKARQNQELIAEIKRLIAAFKDLQIIKVKGHSGHPDNERADRLAVGSLSGENEV